MKVFSFICKYCLTACYNIAYSRVTEAQQIKGDKMDHLLELAKKIKTEKLDYLSIGDKYMLVQRVDGIWLEESSFDFTGKKLAFICE